MILSASPGGSDHDAVPAPEPEALVIELHGLLRQLRRTVAVAESLTGGLLTAALTAPAGASEVVRGGLTVYATDLKVSLAGVDPHLLAARGPVDPDVAAALAVGARARLRADYGLAITGVAGPAEQGAGVGTVYVAVAGPDRRQLASHCFDGDRTMVRMASVQAALLLLRQECQLALATLHLR